MIEVIACARLHLGLLDINGNQGRLYGSLGVAVSRPAFVLRAGASPELEIEGPESDRVAAYTQRFLSRYGRPSGASITILETIPAHTGLGSGTQLAMATGTALAKIAGLSLTSRQVAMAVGRGAHSGVGISTFQHGGFVLDAGRRVGSEVGSAGLPPMIFQHRVPEDWLFVIAIPDTGQGLNGAREDSALRGLPQAPERLAEKISRLVLMKMLPALVEEDIVEFGQAMTSIQFMVGDCFASAQGGRFASPLLEKLVEFMLSSGAEGVGQSSWGPTVYGLVQGSERAERLVRAVRSFLGSTGGQVFWVKPQNHGAEIKGIAI